jgi:predicted AAA+ superfamily ATPase
MEIATLISDQNPQWVDLQYLPAEHNWLKREVFFKIQNWFNKRFILALTGLRRVGKSTIQKQIISDLIKDKKGKLCLYFSFEKIPLKRNPMLIKEIIDWYLEKVLFKKIYQIKEKVYIFLDEVQNIPQWQEMIKFYYDQNQNFKFFICGSNSLFIKKKSRESLGGRIIEIKIFPLSFQEYLKLKQVDFQIFPKNKIWILSNIGILNSHFENYLRFGQFPEVIAEKLTKEQAITYFESIEEKISQQDLPKIFTVEFPEVLLAIFNQIKKIPGQRIEYQSLAKDVGLDQRTLSKYFDDLEKGYLINLCLNFGKKPIKAPRIAKKVYLSSSNFAYNASISLLVENYVFNWLKQRYSAVYFQKDKEIDFVSSDKEGNIFLFEVKYQNQISKNDTVNLLDFMKKNTVKQSVLVTKGELNLNGVIKQIPVSLLEFYL